MPTAQNNPALTLDQFARAYIEANDVARRVACETLESLRDPDLDEDDRVLLLNTLRGALFPDHDQTGQLGLDVEAWGERMVTDHSEAAGASVELEVEKAEFAERVAHHMKRCGMTQAQLADRIGIKQPAVSLLLHRRCRPQNQTIVRMAAALGVQPSDLWPNWDVRR